VEPRRTPLEVSTGPAGIDFKTGTTVKSVDAKGKKLTTDSGDTIGYEKLILATGSGVRFTALRCSDTLLLTGLGDQLAVMHVVGCRTEHGLGPLDKAHDTLMCNNRRP